MLNTNFMYTNASYAIDYDCVYFLFSNMHHCWWLTIQASAYSGNKSHRQECTITELSLASLVQTQARYFCPEKEILIQNCALKLCFKSIARRTVVRYYCQSTTVVTQLEISGFCRVSEGLTPNTVQVR